MTDSAAEKAFQEWWKKEIDGTLRKLDMSYHEAFLAGWNGRLSDSLTQRLENALWECEPCVMKYGSAYQQTLCVSALDEYSEKTGKPRVK